MTPTSKKFFAVSKTEIPNKLKKFYVKVTAKTLNVRSWADADSRPCSFSPVRKGAVLAVCDAILALDKKPWYYIKYNGFYGFVNAAYVERMPYDTVITLLSHYNKAIKKYSALTVNEYVSGLDTFKKAETKWKHNKTVGITCVVPLRWALSEMGITRSDGKALIAAVKGSFSGSYSGKVKKNLDLITKGGPIGMTVKEAVLKGRLKKGDIVCWKDITHTATYSGGGYFFYEGGGSCVKNGHYPNGIKLNYNDNYYRNKKISQVLRWKG